MRYSLREALEFHSIMESDWPRRNKSRYVTEIVSWLGFADVIFGGDKRQPEIRLRLQAMMPQALIFRRGKPGGLRALDTNNGRF